MALPLIDPKRQSEPMPPAHRFDTGACLTLHGSEAGWCRNIGGLHQSQTRQHFSPSIWCGIHWGIARIKTKRDDACIVSSGSLHLPCRKVEARPLPSLRTFRMIVDHPMDAKSVLQASKVLVPEWICHGRLHVTVFSQTGNHRSERRGAIRNLISWQYPSHLLQPLVSTD